MTFHGFGEHAIDFYDGLVADNSKTYWQQHVDTYRADVRAPMEALLAELAPEFAPGFGTGKVFRPYRDLRFAKDKTPYKTHCGAVIEPGRGAGAYYVEIGPAGLVVGGGCFRLAADQLERYRNAVDTDIHGQALVDIVRRLEGAGWRLDGDALKTKPRGFRDDHPRIQLLRQRTLYALRVWEPSDMLHERECLYRVRESWRQLRSLNEWAVDHVGVSDLPRR